ncbi:glycosyltransferase family 2 protein [Snuella sedimenti]|uniref:Glycosyltransferase family 2 protein n=1 Tax=Snuella sedimenti TaxID=2798802 RepID=A0A8J7J6F2_9FLAO|nr:glycosyltransferase family A protein [Snuella sedimenti]MBJ6369299.1 glycosyltransferase family 2 protein [Snuella sedimenti]
MMPFFSVIIPLYNKGNYIKNTLESVLNQTFQDFEIIVIDDGSFDNGKKIVSTVSDKRVNLYSTHNKGVSHARNYAISKAKANLIAFLDADDIWLPNHLQDLKTLHKNYPNCGLYCKAYFSQYKKIIIKSIYKNIPKDKYWMGIVKDYFDSSMVNSIAWTSAVMIPKNVFKRVGGFNENYNSGEDTDLWIRIALIFNVAFYNKVSAIYNLLSENKITNSSFTNRKHFDLDVYESNAKANLNLKKYLDLNRFSMAIQYKLENNHKPSKILYQKITPSNLSSIKKIIFHLPNGILNRLLKLRHQTRRININLRLFR